MMLFTELKVFNTKTCTTDDGQSPVRPIGGDDFCSDSRKLKNIHIISVKHHSNKRSEAVPPKSCCKYI